MRESKIESYLRDEVLKRKGEIRKLRFLDRVGAPDRLVWIPGWSFPRLVELKRPRKGAGDHQTREHARLRRMGFTVVVLASIPAVDRFLRA